MKIFIENYRGIEIHFETAFEKFECVLTDGVTSSSFATIKKHIDDYFKENQSFAPFWIQTIPTHTIGETLSKHKVVGIRKDGRLVIEDITGKKQQLGEYDLKDYMLYQEENENVVNSIVKFDLETKRIYYERQSLRADIFSKLKIVNLKDYKKTLNTSL